MNKKPFETPRLIDQVILEMDQSILFASVAEYIESVETTGHEVVEYNFDSSSFSHTWE